MQICSLWFSKFANLLPNFTKVQAASPKRNLCGIHAPWQGARVQWKFQFSLHSCSLAGSTSAMKVSNWGGRLHFREVEESLQENYPYRKKRKLFDNNIEVNKLPPPLNGHATCSQVEDIHIVFGKGKKGTSTSKERKTKDAVKVRKDMEAMKITPELAPREIVGKTSTYLPPACYTMSKAEKRKFCQWLSEIKVPSGVVDEDEYDQFDEFPPFSVGITPSNDVLDDTTYLRSDHDEGLEV
ncbi:hypothetical protein Tco_0172776 [Tanacetum coccineum]